MGRIRIARTNLNELKEKTRKGAILRRKYSNYLQKLKENYSQGKISYARYVEILYHKKGGRDIQEWINFLDEYDRDYKKEIQKQEKILGKKRFVVTFICLAMIGLFFFSLSNLKQGFTGFTVQEQDQEFSQKLNLEFADAGNYKWEIKEVGELLSVGLSGSVEGSGTVKVYLDNLLIFEYSGEINEEEALQSNDSNPSQEELLPSSEFKNECKETCNLEELNLSKSSYTLNIETSNAKLKLDEIEYKIIKKVTGTADKENITISKNITEKNITDELQNVTANIIIKENRTIQTQINESKTITAKTNINKTTENVTISTIQYPAVLGQPVKWKKQITPENLGNITIKLPKEAEEIIVNKIENQGKEPISPISITGAVISEKVSKGFLTRLFEKIPNFINKIFNSITGQAVSNLESQEKEIKINLEIDEITEYEIEYETPAPYAIEQETLRGKIVTIIGQETIHYENVLSFTNLDEKFKIKNPSQVKIYWKENNSLVPIQKIEDTNENEIYDYIEWLTPNLSNQTFEIILITKAKHLDENKNFISDIYEQVYQLDDIWSETISNNEYVRVTFEKNLTNQNDITIYPRIVSGTPKIEVYEEDENEKIAEFTSLNSNEYNKVLLTNLQESQDIFDLKIINGDVQIDHIIDPASDYNLSFVAPTPANNTKTTNKSITINVSIINATDLADIKFNWNGVNYSVFENNLVLFYNFNNFSDLGENNTYVVDISGNGNNALAYGNAKSQLTGKYGNSFGFDGSNDNLTVSTKSSNLNARNYTICLWINPVYVTDSSVILRNSKNDVNYNGWILAMDFGYTGCDAGDICIMHSDGTSFTFYEVIYDFPISAWSYWCVAYNTDDDQVRFYVNGTNIGNDTSTIIPDFTSSIFSIGEWSTYDFDGYIDELRIYNESLSDAELKQLYFMDLKKYQTGNWSLYVNQSKSPIAGLNDGVYTYKTFAEDTSGNINSTETRTVTVDTTKPDINITIPINNTVSSNSNQNVNFTRSDTNLESCWYSNDTYLVNRSLGSGGVCVNITNITWSQGNHNVTVWVNDTANNLNQSTINFTIELMPQIVSVWNYTLTTLSSGPNEAPVYSSIIINFTGYSPAGAGNLNYSTAKINITLPGTVVESRENSTCSLQETTGNYANYSCNVTMWWWDGAGIWRITAYIEDNQTNAAMNMSTNFSIGSRTGFVMGPAALTWSGISPGATNQTSNNDPLTLNNTGNDIIGVGEIQINATNLLGEQNSLYGLWSGNFSADWQTGGTCTGAACVECTGTQMNVTTGNYANVSQANLTKGNFTINNGNIGQEQLYFCLRKIGSELIDQPYSTANQGAWTIRILLVALIPNRKRKKKIIKDDNLLKAFNLIADELKKEYSLNKKELLQVLIERLKDKYSISRKEILENIKSKEEIKISVSIFSKNLGALEAITKYMKENLNMNYHEIAKELQRNERTIWTAYKKAIEKQPEKIEVGKTNVFLPISIFENKQLTILESAILYLKEKGMKYSEIANLLHRDQRNIWTIYSRAVKK